MKLLHLWDENLHIATRDINRCDRKLDTKGACLCGVNPGKKNDQKYSSPLLEKNDQSTPTML